MEMIVVTPPRPDLAEPTAILASRLAKRLLDRGMDKNAGDLAIRCSAAQQLDVTRRPDLRVNRQTVLSKH
jgi:hypothetical protein